MNFIKIFESEWSLKHEIFTFTGKEIESFRSG